MNNDNVTCFKCKKEFEPVDIPNDPIEFRDWELGNTVQRCPHCGAYNSIQLSMIPYFYATKPHDHEILTYETLKQHIHT